MTDRTPRTRAAVPPAARGSAISEADPAGALSPRSGAPAQSSPRPGSPAPRDEGTRAPSRATPRTQALRDGTLEGGAATTPAGAAPASPREATSAAPDRTKAIAAAMSEDRGPDSLDAHVRKYIADLGLWGFHVEKSLDVDKGRKNVSARGWPDWTILGTRIIHRELKTERGKVSDEQRDVGRRIRDAGGDWDVWRPRDLLSGRIARELRAITAGPLGLGGAA